MFDLLLNQGADLDGTNKYGDNVCHSLIRYVIECFYHLHVGPRLTIFLD